MQGTLCGLCSGCLHMFWLSACLCGLCTSCPHLCVCVRVCLSVRRGACAGFCRAAV